MIYTVEIIVTVNANSAHQAYHLIRQVLAQGQASRQGVEYVDMEYTHVLDDDDTEAQKETHGQENRD